MIGRDQNALRAAQQLEAVASDRLDTRDGMHILALATFTQSRCRESDLCHQAPGGASLTEAECADRVDGCNSRGPSVDKSECTVVFVDPCPARVGLWCPQRDDVAGHAVELPRGQTDASCLEPPDAGAH